MESYRAGVLEPVQRYGGEHLPVGGRCDVVEGSWTSRFPVLNRFPSLAQAHRWYDSEE